MIVSVLHEKGQDKTFNFFVPRPLIARIELGSIVLCWTRYGVKTGIVRHITPTSEDISETTSNMLKKYAPLKPIIGVVSNINMRHIVVPVVFEELRPKLGKMIKALQDYYMHDEHRTNVIIDTNGYLLDGYTAYLMYKMFDHTNIIGFIVDSDIMERYSINIADHFPKTLYRAFLIKS